MEHRIRRSLTALVLVVPTVLLSSAWQWLPPEACSGPWAELWAGTWLCGPAEPGAEPAEPSEPPHFGLRPLLPEQGVFRPTPATPPGDAVLPGPAWPWLPFPPGLTPGR